MGAMSISLVANCSAMACSAYVTYRMYPVLYIYCFQANVVDCLTSAMVAASGRKQA